jgi:hypothetical protein
MSRPLPDGGGGNTTSAKFPTLDNAQNKFNDLGAAFRNAVAPLQGHEQKAVSGAGEFAPQLQGGAAKFLLSWREAFSVCEQTSGLIAGNIGKTKVDLKSVDIDASTAITL